MLIVAETLMEIITDFSLLWQANKGDCDGPSSEALQTLLEEIDE